MKLSKREQNWREEVHRMNMEIQALILANAPKCKNCEKSYSYNIGKQLGYCQKHKENEENDKED